MLRKRASQKSTQATEKSKAAEAAYQKSVEVANDTIKKTYSEGIPPLLESLQSIETERYSQFSSVLTEFLTAQKTVPSGIDERCQEMDKQISLIDCDADLSEFVSAHPPANSEPQLLQFLGTNSSPSSSSSSSSGSSSKETEKPKDEKTEPIVSKTNEKPAQEEEYTL